MQTIKVKNPILRGFNPDPNILRAKDRYYIIVSSFEWLPGIRVYESKNLVNWSHTTDILTTQVSLQGNPTNGSIWETPFISWVYSWWPIPPLFFFVLAAAVCALPLL